MHYINYLVNVKQKKGSSTALFCCYSNYICKYYMYQSALPPGAKIHTLFWQNDIFSTHCASVVHEEGL